MRENNVLDYIEDVLANMPSDWLSLTTHRLDIYDEQFAKTQFLEQFEILYNTHNTEKQPLCDLPTAFDYIRLGHPLSCILEWAVAKLRQLKPDNVISFSSKTMPVLAILRKNLFEHKSTQIVYTGELPDVFDFEAIRHVYGYNFDLKKVEKPGDIAEYEGSTVFISSQNEVGHADLTLPVDFYISLHAHLGSLLLVNGDQNDSYVSEIQHVRRRESIAITPANCLTALQLLTGKSAAETASNSHAEANKARVIELVKGITSTTTEALIGSSGLSVQYAIMMGLVDHAQESHAGKAIKIIVPPNCYGGTNDQARRVAAYLDHVEVVDLPVDGDHNMVQSIDMILSRVAAEDAVPYIIAEIPTNPRVEVPDLDQLKAVLSQPRKTATDEVAIDPVFILDQTFCPNVQFLGEDGILPNVRTISYVSGSKFPSGGKCTAGYCVTNEKAKGLLGKIEKHLILCDNEATDLQIEILADQLPSMNERIHWAYKNTREFVRFIEEVLPAAKINFVSEKMASQGFTPSVFSLDLPTKGSTDIEREAYKRELNLKLIKKMIREIPNESKYCVSYGQLKGCYWTIPATSTQGTTKEGDKDYIARVALSPDMDMDLHKKTFLDFIKNI
ncbi:MAG: cystathionine beta-synthase [Cyclobacteriaceae bacterium]